jgi:hypothetical protein
MIFQLIFDVSDEDIIWQYFLNMLIVIFARSLDILSTRYVTKELKLETNKLARKVGWKGMILMQIPTIILGSLDFYLALFIFVWSLLLFANNIEGSWYVKEIGEDRYQKELKTHLVKAKKWQVLFGEISYILTFTVSGILIIVFLFVYNDVIAVFFIALALICEGVIATVRSLSYLLELRQEEPKKKKKEIKKNSD